MSLKAKRKPANNIPPLDGGTYMSVCVGVIDLGEQYRQFDKQKQGKYAEECMFIFEIPSERVQVDGEAKPRWLSSKRYTVSLHERSALYQMLTSWRGKALSDAELDPEGDGFDLMQMAGQGAMLSVSVVEKDDGSRHNKIEAVTGFPKGKPVFRYMGRLWAVFHRRIQWSRLHRANAANSTAAKTTARRIRLNFLYCQTMTPP